MRIQPLKDYDSMTNQELLATARERGMHVSATWNNRLAVIRGAADDRIGEQDRREFVSMLRRADADRSARYANIVSTLAFVIAVASLIWTIWWSLTAGDR